MLNDAQQRQQQRDQGDDDQAYVIGGHLKYLDAMARGNARLAVALILSPVLSGSRQ